MNRVLLGLVLGGLCFAATGCEKKSARLLTSIPLTTQDILLAEPPHRFIAESHELEVITPESKLQKSWESAVAFCATIQCEVLSSKITTRTLGSTPSGTVSLRVVPPDLTKLLAHIQTLGSVVQHTTQREDKTTEVVDTDAKVKNLTSFRDNLRAMLAKPSATVKDLIEIQHQLTETQSELDSQTAQRRILANETEKIAVAVSLRVEESRRNASGFAQISDALRESGYVFADSTASLITVIVAIIPWLFPIVLMIWLSARIWRRLRRRRTALPPPTPAAP